jgi:hypothetical protein
MPEPTNGARLSFFSKEMVDRIAGMAAGVVNTFRGAPSVQPQRTAEPWFGPGKPLLPVAPKEDVAGRAFDFPTAININIRPRAYEGVSFEQLRRLAEGFDIVRLAIETRKDQMSKLEWSISPRIRQADEVRAPADERCEEVEEFLRFPDRKSPWHTWQRQLLEDQLVIDAPSIYIRRTQSGKPYSLEVLDGSTIVPRLDKTGRQPEPPTTAYQQVLKGMPAVDYTTLELIYAPRNPRPGKMYGLSPVEQIITTINIAIRREVQKLAYYSEGNIPEALVSVPKDWQPDQIARFQEIWDAMMSDQLVRRRMKFVPGEMSFQPTRSDQALMDQFDEWLARVVCYAFSLPPIAFVRMMNKATAATSYETALEEGLQPMMLWFKGIMDYIVQKVFGYEDLEFVWDAIDKIDPADQQDRDMRMIQQGLKSIDEVRAGMGMTPIGMKHAIWGIGPAGIMFVDDLLEAKSAGLLKIQPPPPPMMDPTQPGQDPSQAPAMIGQDPSQGDDMDMAQVLAGVPPALLQAVGLGNPAARAVDVTDQEAAQSDPLAVHAAHPNVLRALRDFESIHKV